MKYPRKFIELECKDESDEVVCYAPVKSVLFLETKEYTNWGTFLHCIVSSEVVYHSILKEFVKNNDLLNTKFEVRELFDSYEDCKQACIKDNERLLSQKTRVASILGNKWKLNAQQMTRYVKNTQKRYADIQDKILEQTDELYGEKSNSLNGSNTKQFVQKVKSNNKENQGK